MATQEEIRALIEQMPTRFQPEKAQGINATIQLNLSGDNGGQWWVRIADGKAEMQPGSAPKADMTLSAAADDMYNVFTGKMNAVSAFMQGKIKVAGDMSLAIKMQNMFSMG